MKKQPESLVKGSGPELLSCEGKVVAVGDTVYVIYPRPSYGDPLLPKPGVVASMDLTARSVRIQLKEGGEVVYWADDQRRSGDRPALRIFTTINGARAAVLPAFKKVVASANEDAERYNEKLSEARKLLDVAAAWRG